MSDNYEQAESYGFRQLFGLVVGLAGFALLLILPAPEGMSESGMRVAAVAMLMAVWWICEPIPVYATAFLPLVLFPFLNVMDVRAAAAPYANPTIFLFMGGFMIALAMQRWGLHKRIALRILSWTGTGPQQLVGGVIAATVSISMWINNTSATLMMLPIALSILPLMDSGDKAESARFKTAMVLGVAYGASIGGLATLIGTAPNALLAGFMQQRYGYTVSFASWMMVGLPMSIIIASACWFLLCRVLFPLSTKPVPGVAELLRDERAALGPMSRGEIIVAVAFAIAVVLWVFQPIIAPLIPFLRLSDAGIAMAVAMALFVIPIDLKRGEFVLNWEWANKMPWALFILFGGGLSLADAAGSSGLAEWLGTTTSSFTEIPTPVMVIAFVALIVFFSEIASNTAATATLLPVLAAAAVALGENPLLFCIAGAMAASGGFMLPVATPPNAIAFGSGHVNVQQMARAGVRLDLIWILVVTIGVLVLLPAVFDVDFGVRPEWAVQPK